MHHPGEDNIALMRTHQDLVRYRNRDDDTFMLVVETIAEKLSEILENPVDYDGMRHSLVQEQRTALLLEAGPSTEQRGLHHSVMNRSRSEYQSR